MVKKLGPSEFRILFDGSPDEKIVAVKPYHWMLVEQAGKDLETIEATLLGLFFAMKNTDKKLFDAWASTVVDMKPIEDEEDEDAAPLASPVPSPS